jgi:hypothetical protein
MSKIIYPDPRLFWTKTLVIVLASYLFVPIMALHDAGDLSSLAYAIILVVLHLAFLVIYLYKVQVRKLDADYRSVAARVLGLAFCVALLMVVSQFIQADAGQLGKLALVLLLLCVVHTAILFLLMVKTEPSDASSTEKLISP